MSNPFESGQRKVIPAVLIYPKWGDQVLMLHRNTKGRPGDYHSGKWNGLGGKLELDESPLEGAVREFSEESGLTLPESAFKPLGVLQFPNFKALQNEDWLVTVFVAHLKKDNPDRVPSHSEEGELHWISTSEIFNLNLWPGDRHFLPFVLEEKAFIGTIWYHGPEVSRWWLSKLD